MANMKKIQELAERITNLAEKIREKDNSTEPTEFWIINYNQDPEGEKIREMVFNAHENFLPDNYKYSVIIEALENIGEVDAEVNTKEEEFMDQLIQYCEPDIYTDDLLKWLKSDIRRTEYCDQFLEEIGRCENQGILEIIQGGQWIEKRGIYYSIFDFLCHWAEELEQGQDK